MDITLQLNVECPECGAGIEYPFRAFVTAAEYTLCQCGEVEIQTYFNDTLHINFLRKE